MTLHHQNSRVKEKFTSRVKIMLTFIAIRVKRMAMKVNTQKIKREIKRREIGVARLAKEVGITRQGLYLILKKKTTSLSTLNKLARILKIDARDLLT